MRPAAMVPAGIDHVTRRGRVAVVLRFIVAACDDADPLELSAARATVASLDVATGAKLVAALDSAIEQGSEIALDRLSDAALEAAEAEGHPFGILFDVPTDREIWLRKHE